MCAVGTHAVGALTELCPGFDDGNYVNNWFSATDYVGAFSPGSDAENNGTGWTVSLLQILVSLNSWIWNSFGRKVVT